MAENESVKTAIRRRLIGLAAVVAITLAISPLLFDAAGYKERQLENRIPLAPAKHALMEVTPIYQTIPEAQAPAQPGSTAEVAPPSDAIIAAAGDGLPEVLPSDDTPGLDSRGIPVAWTLQLASFKDERNAKALRMDLNAAGYKVYIRHSDELVRVYIGPEMQRSRLENLQEAIKKDYSLDGMILRFTTE